MIQNRATPNDHGTADVAMLPVATPTDTKTTNKVIFFSVLSIVAFQFSGYFCNVVSFYMSI